MDNHTVLGSISVLLVVGIFACTVCMAIGDPNQISDRDDLYGSRPVAYDLAGQRNDIGRDKRSWGSDGYRYPFLPPYVNPGMDIQPVLMSLLLKSLSATPAPQLPGTAQEVARRSPDRSIIGVQ